MNGNCHFVFGATVGSMMALNNETINILLPNISNSPETATLFVLGGLIGGIFPDIDNPSSHMGQLSAPLSTIIGKINKLFGKIGSNHRGILHDPIIYIIGLILSYFFFSPLIGFFIGCLSHIFLDMFNPNGVPFLFIHKIILVKFKSGEKGSIIFTIICIIITLFIGFFIKFR